MPYRDESKLMPQDAPADVSTELCFFPPNGPFDGESEASTVVGTLTSKHDVDWIALEMSEGKEYTFTLAGSDMLTDTKIRLLDSKGGEIMALDDVDTDGDGIADSLHPTIKFTPEAGSGTQKYFIEVSAYTGNPGSNVITAPADYTVTADEMDLPEPTTGKTLMGTERVPDDATTADIDETVLGDDKIKGTDMNDMISGLSGDDSLYGMGGDDTLDGGDGNDLLSGGPGADTLKGGDGDDDTIAYSSSMMGVTINLTDGTARGGDADGDTIVDMGDDKIENVIGSMYDDTLTGSTAKNKLWGLGGNDELDGGRRDDMLYGGDGNDGLDGGAGNDTLEGGYGADMLTGGENTDTASYSMSMMGVTVRLHSRQAMGGDAEGDTWSMSGTPVKYMDSDEEEAEVTVVDIENLTGSANADILAGDLRDNTIKGGGGDDKIYGGPNPADADKEGDPGLTNADMLKGEGGNDMLFGGYGDDELHGGPGDDTLNGGAGEDGLYGGAGSDMIYADADDVTINGWVEDPPDDPDNPGTALTEAASDPMTADTVSYARLEEGVARSLASPTAVDGVTFTITNVENIIGSQGVDTLTGSDGPNVIEGGESGDTLDGGDGEDTLSYEHSDDWVRITLAAIGTAATASRGHASGDTATNFENVRGSAYDDDLSGGADTLDLDSKLWGMAGDDDMDGGGGDDMLEGGAGADELDGGYTDSDGGTAGNQGNSEVNTVSYEKSDAGVTVNLATSSATGGHATGDTIVTYEELSPTEDDENNEIDVATFANVTGSMHDDRLTGNHHDNELTGGAGDDTLRGGASNAGDRTTAAIIRGDVLVGGPGADMLDGGEDEGEKDDMVPDPADTDLTDGQNMLAASVDWAVYKHAMEGVTVDLSTNRGTGGEAMGDTLRNIELVWGSEKDDTFISGPGGDNIEGDGGSDTVSYEASSLGVTVNLGEAAQHRTVAATGTGTDDDPFVFGPDADPAVVVRPTTGVPAILQDSNAEEDEDDNPNTNGARGDRLGSIENLTGSDHDDTLMGDANPNVLKGGGGVDMLTGAGSNDTLEGGAGDDTLNGGIGADTLMGGAGDDTLNGDGDDDKLVGGAGNDDLFGGTGNDTFVFSTEDAGDSDAILDYTDGDMIDLTAFDLTAEQVIEAIIPRGTGDNAYVVINLEAHGGGRITIDDVSDLDTFDDDGVTTGDGAAADDGEINTLDEGIFIL